MPPTGRGKRKILFVGEAPGETEDKLGVQLVGKTGQYLRAVLRKLDLELDDCWKTNAVTCRPPGNKIQRHHVDGCRPNLVKTVRRLKPRVVLLLGGSAVRSLLQTERDEAAGSIARWVGWKIPSQEYGAWLCPTYHPSYLLRMNDRVLDLIFRRHVADALKLEHQKPPQEPLEKLQGTVERLKDTRQVKKRLEALAGTQGTIAFDYEANALKPDQEGSRLASVSFCLNGEETFAFPMRDSLKPALSAVLRSRGLRKIAANLKNEERWTRAILGHPVQGWFWDTMLSAHVLDNRTAISGLKFQAFVRFGIADYARPVEPYFESTAGGFNRVFDCPIDDLLTYNGLDSLLTYRLAMLQREEMGL
jgi:DNA polymerase